jgi:hypothetical protein
MPGARGGCLPGGPRGRALIGLVMGQVGLTGPARYERKGFLFFFIHFSMNTKVKIKSRKIARIVRKNMNFFKID